MVLVDSAVVQRFASPYLAAHRVDRHTAVHPHRCVAGEEVVGEGADEEVVLVQSLRYQGGNFSDLLPLGLGNSLHAEVRCLRGREGVCPAFQRGRKQGAKPLVVDGVLEDELLGRRVLQCLLEQVHELQRDYALVLHLRHEILVLFFCAPW